MRTGKNLVLVSTVAVVVCALLAACGDSLDLNRQESERGTLGQELYRVFLRDLERTPHLSDLKVEAFKRQEESFVWAIDTIMPSASLEDLKELLLRLLPLWDDDTLPDFLRKTRMLSEEVAGHEELLQAWVRTMHHRDGYVHESASVDVLDRLANYPRLSEAVALVSRLVLEHDGLQSDGSPDPDENDFFARILLVLDRQLREPRDHWDRERAIALVSDLVLRSDERFNQVARANPAWAVRLDPRGLAASGEGLTSRLPPLFSDEDGDGLPDVVPDGRFLAPNREPFVLRPYGQPNTAYEVHSGLAISRDHLGRAHLAEGAAVYAYVDLQETPLGYVIRRAPELIQSEVITNLFIGLDGLLGELDRSGELARFSDQGPLLDLNHALFAILDYELSVDLTEAAATLLRQHEGLLATLLLVFEDSLEIVREAGGSMAPNNTLIDDLLPYVDELLQSKGLLDDLLDAVQSPLFGYLFDSLEDMLAHYHPHVVVPLESEYERRSQWCIRQYDVGTAVRADCLRALPRDLFVAGPSDYSAVGTDAYTSLANRLMHLIYVSSEVPFEMVIEEVSFFEGDISNLGVILSPLVTIPDTAAAFFDAVAGTFCMADYVNLERFREDEALTALMQLAATLGVAGDESEFADVVVGVISFLSDEIGAHLDPCPTAAQLTRFYNLSSYEVDMGPIYMRIRAPLDKEGYVFSEHLADTLLVAEAMGGIDGLHPFLVPISERGLSPLLGRLIAAVYRHWPESGELVVRRDGSIEGMAYSGLRRHEPALLDIIRDGRITWLLPEVAETIQGIDTGGSLAFPQVLQEIVGHLLDGTSGLLDRTGRDFATRRDGERTALNRFYLLRNAFDAMEALLEDDPLLEAAWEDAAGALVDLLIEVELVEGGRGRFSDPGGPALASILLEHVAYHLRRQVQLGIFQERVGVDYPRWVEDLLTSAGFAAVIELMREVQGDPEDLALFNDFLVYLLEGDRDLTLLGLNLLYTFLFFATDPVGFEAAAPLLADIVDPGRVFQVASTPNLPYLSHAMLLLERMLELDPEDVGLDLLRRAISLSDGEIPFFSLARVVRDLHREQPGSAAALTAADMESIFFAVVDFIGHEVRGMERVVALIKERSGPIQADNR